MVLYVSIFFSHGYVHVKHHYCQADLWVVVLVTTEYPTVQMCHSLPSFIAVGIYIFSILIYTHYGTANIK